MQNIGEREVKEELVNPSGHFLIHYLSYLPGFQGKAEQGIQNLT